MSALEKSPDAFRTISEVAEDLDVPQHVLRFWESKFAQVKPLKRAGGRRYYRPEDVDMLRGIRTLLYSDGFTIKGVQRVFREQGLRYVIETGRMAAREQIAGDDRPLPVSRSHSGTASSHAEPEIIVEDEAVEEEVSIEADETFAPQAEVSPTITPIVASPALHEEPLLLDTPIDEPAQVDEAKQGLSPQQRESLTAILEELEDLKTRLTHAKSQAHRMAAEQSEPEQVEFA